MLAAPTLYQTKDQPLIDITRELNPDKSGFPNSVKIYLGLGISLVMYADLALGWFVFRWRKSKGI